MTLLSAALPDIPWDQIDPHSVIITRLEGEQLDQFIYVLRDKVGDTVKVMPMSPDTEIFVIDEKEMNKMGWFRSKP